MRNALSYIRLFKILIVAILKTRNLSPKLKAKKRILYLAKPIFNDDISQIDKQCDKIVFIRFPRLELSKIVRLAVSDFERLSDQAYWNVLTDAEIAKVNRLVAVFFGVYRFFWPFDGVATGNYTYVSQQGFAVYCVKKKIPFVVLYKEGTLIKFREPEKQKTLFDGKLFVGTHLLLPNQTTKDLFESYGTFHDAKVKILTTGIPRFEIYKQDIPLGDKIVFFYFDPSQKASIASGRVREDALDELTKQLRDILSRLSIASKNHPVVLKTKNRNELEKLRQFIVDQDVFFQSENVRFDSSSSAFNLLEQAFCVVGNFSTTLVEARLAGRKVFSPLSGLHEGDTFFRSIGVRDISELEDYLSRNEKVQVKVAPDLVEAVCAHYSGDVTQNVANILLELGD